MHGTGHNTRNFLFVEDVARAFEVVFHKGEVGQVYNIGGSNEFANIEVARKLMKEMGKVADDTPEAWERAEEELITYAPDRPFNDGAWTPGPFTMRSYPSSCMRCVLCVCVAVHYHLDSSKLGKLGWREEVSWDEGIVKTIEWYKVNSGNWGDLTSALVAHPRRGLTPAEIAGDMKALESRASSPRKGATFTSESVMRDPPKA